MKDQGMKRLDGTRKSNKGYLGQIKRDDGSVMTEFSIGVEMGGKEVQIPTLVPTLTKQDIEILRTLPEGNPVPKNIVKKAVDHAIPFLQKGQSPFYKEKKSLIKSKTKNLKQNKKSLIP